MDHDTLRNTIAAALALVQFPHRDWSLISDEVQGHYIQDAEEFLAALSLAQLKVVERKDP